MKALKHRSSPGNPHFIVIDFLQIDHRAQVGAAERDLAFQDACSYHLDEGRDLLFGDTRGGRVSSAARSKAILAISRSVRIAAMRSFEVASAGRRCRFRLPDRGVMGGSRHPRFALSAAMRVA